MAAATLPIDHSERTTMAVRERREESLSDSFTCSICGQTHGGLVTDWGYTLPDEVWAIPEPERSEKARFNNDLCQFDGRSFIRCVLNVPFAEASGHFGWGAWAEVDGSTFERYLELYDEDGTAEAAHMGKLANALPAYPGSLGTPVMIQFGDPTERPSLHSAPADESRLAREQRTGIGEVRYHEILNIIQDR